MSQNFLNNILFLGGGRRVELAKRFIDRGYRVFSYELNDRVPISSVADIINGYPWNHYGIINHLISVIQNYEIKLVIPLQDQAVLVAANLPQICAILAPEIETAETCFDKKKFENFVLSNEQIIDLYPITHEDRYPKIVKPRFGFGSKGIKILNTPFDEANFFEFLRSASYPDFIIQSKISGIEYSVDSFFSKESEYIDSVPRQRIRIGSGEVITSMTVEHVLLRQEVKDVGELLGLVGPANFQFMVTPENYIYIIEVNSRFGGGYTLSMEAGLDAIQLIEEQYFPYMLINKSRYIPDKWTRNILLERSYEDHFFKI